MAIDPATRLTDTADDPILPASTGNAIFKSVMARPDAAMAAVMRKRDESEKCICKRLSI